MLPDETVLVVGIGRADGADDGVPGGVLFDLHDVAGALEHRRLVHVLHDDLDGGLVPEGPHGEEAWVDVGVLHLNAEAVLALPLKVQRLRKTKTEDARPVTLCCFVSSLVLFFPSRLLLNSHLYAASRSAVDFAAN